MQFNTTIEELEIGIRHGNVKKKIFNQQLYEKERKLTTQKLSHTLSKVFAKNKTLKKLFVQYRHANLEESIRIGLHLINTVRLRTNGITHFNGFPVA